MSRSARRFVSIGAEFKPRVVIRLACGQDTPVPSGDSGPDWIPDNTYGGTGSSTSTTNAVNTTKVSPAAPVSIYQYQRVGTFAYTLTGLKYNVSYLLKFHLNEYTVASAGARTFSLKINNVSYLPAIDVYTGANGANTAYVWSRTVRALADNTITILAQAINGQPVLCGLEVIGVTGNNAPSIPPGPPTNLVAVPYGLCMRVAWTASLPGTNVHLQYSIVRQPALTFGTGTTATSYIDYYVSPQTAYTYTVTARDDTALSSTPATSPSATTRALTGTIFSPSTKEMVLRMLSSILYGTTNWQTTYRQIADAGDGRGYVCGLGGFSTSLGYVDDFAREYSIIHSSGTNPWSNAYDVDLNTIRYTFPYANRASTAHSLLDPSFVTDWQSRSDTDAQFRQAQLRTLENWFMHPIVIHAIEDDTLGELGQFIYLDCLLQHTDRGFDSDTFDMIRTRALAVATPPSLGGDEATYLHAFLDERRAVLVAKGWAVDRIDTMQRQFVNDGNLHLSAPLSWTVGGSGYTIATAP